MAWCPKCKSEYREGISQCVDCKCELVDSLQTAKVEAVVEAENWNYSEEVEAEHIDDASQTEETVEPEENKYRHAYINNTDKAQENKSSAYTLLLVGGAGFIVIILFFFGIVPINVSDFSRYMISGVMGAMFILFLVMGIVTMKNYKILKKKAGKENNLTQEIKKWCMDNLTTIKIDNTLDIEELEEVKYFKRFDKIKALIQNQFMNLDEAYLDCLIDEIYSDIFEADAEAMQE